MFKLSLCFLSMLFGLKSFGAPVIPDQPLDRPTASFLLDQVIAERDLLIKAKTDEYQKLFGDYKLNRRTIIEKMRLCASDLACLETQKEALKSSDRHISNEENRISQEKFLIELDQFEIGSQLVSSYLAFYLSQRFSDLENAAKIEVFSAPKFERTKVIEGKRPGYEHVYGSGITSWKKIIFYSPSLARVIEADIYFGLSNDLAQSSGQYVPNVSLLYALLNDVSSFDQILGVKFSLIDHLLESLVQGKAEGVNTDSYFGGERLINNVGIFVDNLKAY